MYYTCCCAGFDASPANDRPPMSLDEIASQARANRASMNAGSQAAEVHRPVSLLSKAAKVKAAAKTPKASRAASKQAFREAIADPKPEPDAATAGSGAAFHLVSAAGSTRMQATRQALLCDCRAVHAAHVNQLTGVHLKVMQACWEPHICVWEPHICSPSVVCSAWRQNLALCLSTDEGQ